MKWSIDEAIQDPRAVKSAQAYGPLAQTRGSIPFELETSDGDYPRQLLDYEDAPPMIYGRGEVASLTPGIAIIGARNATPYGVSAARAVATWACEMDLTVYSGCARGCDQAAHRAALEAGGKTVAILGCGADVIYPRGAAALLERIAQTGAVISQYSWGTPPAAFRFRARNWLIAALSQFVVVVEARIPSGTFSTVEHALSLGVGLAAVPGSIFCAESRAPNRFISEGAIPLTCREDLFAAFNRLALISETVADAEGSGRDGDRWGNGGGAGRRSGGDRSASGRCGARQDDPLLSALSSQAYSAEELARDLSLKAREVTLRCSRYEVEGLVQRSPDGRYSLTPAELLRRV